MDFYSNERYRLQSSNAGKEIDNGVLKLFSIKVKRIKNQTRYEVGDSIFFKKNNKKDESPSIGRIKAMYHYDKIERIIEIELLVSFFLFKFVIFIFIFKLNILIRDLLHIIQRN